MSDNARKVREKRVGVALGARHNFWLDQRVQRTARALSSSGYEVFAYTPSPSRKNERPFNQVRSRYVSFPGHGSRLFRRLVLDYLLYNVPLAFRMVLDGVDICHCNDFDTLPAGVLVKMATLGRARLVYDSHEDYPSFVEEGYGKTFGQVIGAAERFLAGHFVDRAIGVNERITSRFESEMGIRSEAIFNCQDVPGPGCSIGEFLKSDGDFWVVYQGYLARMRGYEQLIDAAELLKRRPDIKFLVVGKSQDGGTYMEHLIEVVRQKGLERSFVFTGYLEYSSMMRLLQAGDTGLVLFQPSPNSMHGLPNKLFENMAAGIPTVASNFPEMAGVIRGENCGLLVDPARPAEIAGAIEYLYLNRDAALEMGRNALKAAREKYNFGKQAEKLLRLYRELPQ